MGSVKILKASAGSGKTYQLSYVYIRNVISSPWLYRNILAVTFTNKATEEMKSRILKEINILASGGDSSYMNSLVQDTGMSEPMIRRRAAEARTKILHDYGNFNVVTIDKFFQRIIRSFIKELGIDLSFTLELQTESILESAADRLIEEIKTDEKLREWVMQFVEEKMEANKKWDIRTEIAELGREIFKEQYKVISQSHLPADELNRVVSKEVALSRAIIGRMKEIADIALGVISSHGLIISDFAYGGSGCIGYFVKMNQGLIEPYGKRVLDAVESEAKWYSKTSSRKGDIIAVIPELQPLLKELCQMYDQNIVAINTTQLVRENFRSFALLERLAQKATEICSEQNIVPISETNTIINKLIEGNDTPFIYEKTGSRISHFMIDEFQDTSLQQWGNFVPLLDNALSQSEDNPVLLVGDVKQSIYRWRGGDWQILGRMVKEHFMEVVEQNLDTNYRSFGVVVNFNNNMIGEAVRQDNVRLNTTITDLREQGLISTAVASELTDMVLLAYDEQCQKPSREPAKGYVGITKVAKQSDTELKPMIISLIEELQGRGYTPSDIAVLVRYNREGVAIAKELLDYKALHPESEFSYDLVTQEALTIGNSEVVNFIIAVMSLAVSVNSSIQQAVYNRYLGREVNALLPVEDKAFLVSLRVISIEEVLELILQRFGLNLVSNNIAYIQALQEQIHAFCSSKIADLSLFLKWWAESGSSKSINLPNNGNAITIITIHKAKGLQYKAVIIPDCTWALTPKSRSLIWAQSRNNPLEVLGKVPLKWKNDICNSHFAEEYIREFVLSHIDNINTFYVAATRAEQELYILIPEDKTASNAINGLITSSIEDGGDIVKVGDLEGRKTESQYGVSYEFGEKIVKPRSPQQVIKTMIYPSLKTDNKLRFSTHKQRYFEDNAQMSLSPRSYGIIMHKIFEDITDYTQIDDRMRDMIARNFISQDEAARAKEMIDEAMKDPLIRSWFEPSWESVHNEHTIIIPRCSDMRRPDRVITKGAKAIVIDYKFGSIKQKKHLTQINEYIELLRSMGYRNIEGFIWYVELNSVDSIP